MGGCTTMSAWRTPSRSGPGLPAELLIAHIAPERKAAPALPSTICLVFCASSSSARYTIAMSGAFAGEQDGGDCPMPLSPPVDWPMPYPDEQPCPSACRCPCNPGARAFGCGFIAPRTARLLILMLRRLLLFRCHGNARRFAKKSEFVAPTGPIPHRPGVDRGGMKEGHTPYDFKQRSPSFRFAPPARCIP